jgi:hypothetical protein
MHARRTKYRRAAIPRRSDIDKAAQKAVRMIVKVMTAIWIGDVRPHIRDVMGVALYRVKIQNKSGFRHYEFNETFHFRELLDVIRRHIGEGPPFRGRETYPRFLQLPQFFSIRSHKVMSGSIPVNIGVGNIINSCFAASSAGLIAAGMVSISVRTQSWR